MEFEDYKRQVKEPIAIIGMSCRFPGGANDIKSFWNLLSKGYDGITAVPSDRWDVEAFYDPDPEAPGKMYVRTGGFLNTPVDTFDAQFFGISPREAEYMDPQQRLLLEVAWEALENSSINPLSLNDSLTGVFLAAFNFDYYNLIGNLDSIENINAYIGTGNAFSALAGRLSYILGLQGPCIAVDTACSSSLVTLDLACKSLRNGECKLALAGGVNMMLNPAVTILECKSHMLSPEGYCKTFDVKADGYARGEGCGIVVLKRLSDAIRDNDIIFGVVRATSVNQDGASSGLTVPNKEAQIALIRQALSYAELDANAIDYIEAHGTGTSLGDPIEVGALSTIFSGRKDHLLWIGSVKTNVGHLEAAAGIAGVIKTVLALNHEEIPPHLHLKHLNPHISLESIPAQIPHTLTSWPRSNRPRIAGVSSFGFSGTNAHAIIEEAPLIEHKKNEIDRPWHLLTLSGKTQGALDQLIDLYKTGLPKEELADIAFTANTGRAHFSHGMTCLAQTKEELLNNLQTSNYLIGQAQINLPKITFIFSGKTFENSELMATSPVFREAMERSNGLFEYALFELWKSWEVVPDYVTGEGSGDVIAAIAAGIITLNEGLKLIAVSNNPEELEKAAKEIQYKEPQCSFLSSWTGQVIRKEGLTADYWKPHEHLRHIPEDTLVISTQSNWKDLLQSLSQLYLNGISINWKGFDKPYNRKKVLLPTYPFQRESYWVDALKARKKKRIPAEAHPLLGEYISSPSEEKLFKNEIDLDFLPYLKDHHVFDSILFPGAGFVELMQRAASKIFKEHVFMLSNIVFDQPLALNLKKPKQIALLAKPKDDGYHASIFSIEEEIWVPHANGELSLSERTSMPKMDWEYLRAVCPKPIDIEDLYQQFDAVGLHYGKQFQTLRKLWTGNNEFIAELEGNTSPALIDGSLQALASLASNAGEEGTVYLPYSIDRIFCFSELGNTIRIHGKLTQVTDTGSEAEIEIFSYEGKPYLKIQGFRIRKTNQNHLQQMLNKQRGPDSASWFYQIRWQPKPLEKVEAELKAPWLIISNQEEIIKDLQAKSVKPEQALAELGKNPPAGVLWFVSGKDSLKHALNFVQTISNLDKKPSLVFITRGSQPIDSITDLDSASFNGFYRTLSMEMPTLDCRHIDLRPHEQLPLKELLAADQEGQVAYRQGVRYVSRFVRIKDFKFPEGLIIKPDGSYLITGGFGGLGFEVAKWLVTQGAKHLVLVGRNISQKNDIPNAIIEKAFLDVSQKQAVETLMKKFGKEWPELKGIIHAAGVLDDGMISSQNWNRFEKVFAPKVQGSWNLHEASLNKPLDFFVLFSSIASSLGSPGQINYSSANAYMDALAYFRQEMRLPALTINWGPWAEVGLAAQLIERHRTGGLIAFKPEEGLKAFELALFQTYPQISIVKANWKKVPFQQAFLSELTTSKTTNEPVSPVLLQRLTEALPSERRDILVEYLQRSVGKVLGVSSLNPEINFFDAGMDSLMNKELYEKLQFEIGGLHKLPTTLVFDYPNVQKLTQYFTEYIFPLIGKESGDQATPANLDNRQYMINFEDLNRVLEQMKKDSEFEAFLIPRFDVLPFNPDLTVKKILLTGSTGFVGAFLLKELIEKYENTIIFCLVRANTTAQAIEKIKSNLSRYNLWKEEYVNRIEILLGDLKLENLGIEEVIYTQLLKEIDIIFHVGALVHHSHSYETLRASNVLGTKEIIKIAGKYKIKPIYFVSTAGTDLRFKNLNQIMLAPIIQSNADDPSGLISGYLQSKWVCEKLLIEGRSKGIPSIIFKPGEITSKIYFDKNRHADDRNDIFHTLLRFFIDLGFQPDWKEAVIDIVPVEHVCKVILEMSKDIECLNKTFEIINPQPALFSELCSWLNKKGHFMQPIDYQEWIKICENEIQKISDPKKKNLLEINFKSGRYLNYFSQISVDSTETQVKIKNKGIMCPKALSLFDDYFDEF